MSTARSVGRTDRRRSAPMTARSARSGDGPDADRRPPRRDTVGFMRRNIVVPNRSRPSGRYWMTLEDIGSPGSDVSGNVVQRYELTDGTPNHEDSFEAFWCAYEKDRTHTVTVTDDADYL